MHKPLGPRLLLSVTAILLSLVLGEVVLRTLGFWYPLYPERIEFGYPNPTELEKFYDPDEELFWVRPDYYERLTAAESAIDLVFLGDSCTEFGKYDELLAEQIEADHSEQSLSFANLGCGGWATTQGLAQMQRDVLRLKPKVATLYFGWNDHWVGFGFEDERLRTINRSWLYSLRNVRWIQGLQVALWSKAGEQPLRVPLPRFRSNLLQMVRTAQESGITPVLLTAPSCHVVGREPALIGNRFLPELERLVPLHQEYVQVVREVAREEQVLLCDLAATFAEQPATTLLRELFVADGIHLREAGDRLIAEQLYQCLQSHDLLPGLLRNKANCLQLTGREPRYRRKPVRRGQPELELPLKIELDHATLRPGQGVGVTGWILSTRPIDHLVLYQGERNLGAAHYPIARPDLLEKHPEYQDPWSGFGVQRNLPEGAMAETAGLLRVFSGEDCIGEHRFDFAVVED
jgi:lysophospholipase L1-like esterase